ncbi:MAG: L-glyceraldehyde 3-phosphate reductase [Balneola sp.]|jgi:L-glyceraldehyde 3-phosphate reductase|nr:L-glyceraldehyde 3-phosphate reductase [Balneola sp.]MBE79601.1 L-glyceraldehyde 3-phosphate reductase [Balneola sp.]|tara:strand:+ start:113 stop:1096 length:984 start_codon:yes stop_codon:yes gene_type:complete
MSFSENRYSQIPYRRCGDSGLMLPILSLGLWHNFGGKADLDNARDILRTAFNHGITHFDLANNYGPPPGSAEENFGKILHSDFKGYRDELIISTKAGYRMWDGPYGEWGSRKYLISSIDQSLKRMNLDYVDVFYHHRPDPDTPLEESMMALDQIVRSGKALYAGISNYGGEKTRQAKHILAELGTPFIIHQPMYNMFVRGPEEDLFPVLKEEGIGCIPFSPLSQGLLTNKYIGGIPEKSRIADPDGFLQENDLTQEKLDKIIALNEVAEKRGQSLAQLALVWVLRNEVVTSALIGVSKKEQLLDNIAALDNLELTEEEQNQIESILN